MNGFLAHLALSLRLHFRNRMALAYGYLFPLIFLAAFWVLYRHEPVPLLRHLGELLTVSALGGACFGLPTTLVSERERGVWRRYRLTPAPLWGLIASTVVARYFIILSAGLLQLAVALAVGTTAPLHPLHLFLAFSAVTFAFIGLGLVIAMLADTVPAVQALGQCVFLPMLIIGGVAVPILSLPEWARRLSGYFPGRPAVEALQATVNGEHLDNLPFCLLALAVTAIAGTTAGVLRFRWDTRPRLSHGQDRLGVALVLVAWLLIGFITERREDLRPSARRLSAASSASAAWMHLTAAEIAALDYASLPDDPYVAPIGEPDEAQSATVTEQLTTFRRALETLPRFADADPVGQTRHLLAMAALADLARQPAERQIPLVVLAQLQARHADDTLMRLLAWIALHPDEGEVPTHLTAFGRPEFALDESLVRQRTEFYALKFILRLQAPPRPLE